jgi:hypothetical protein
MVRLDDLSPHPGAGEKTFQEWLDLLPSQLAGREVREVVDRWVDARRSGRTVIWALGAHLIKVGLSRWLIALMEEGLVTHLAVNGAVAIHDYELAAVGHTSEDVARGLAEGSFGQAGETAEFINQAAKDGAVKGIGLGEALAEAMHNAGLPHGDVSVLAAAGRIGLPVSVHLALGADTIHSHPSADGSSLGQTSLLDFQRFSHWVSLLEGGLYFNVGSAVIMPEIFLKAVSLARTKGSELAGLTTVVMDFIRHYRPMENVCRRPPGPTGRGFYLVGHHEIMVPLMAQAALSRWPAGG